MDSYVRNSMKLSLIVQFLAGFISLLGMYVTVQPEDQILTELITLDTLVQFVEATFYIWFFTTAINVTDMASYRYFDWVITTPIMLVTIAAYFKYNELKEKKTGQIMKFKNFIKEYSRPLAVIAGANMAMLVFGYLGETKRMNLALSNLIGFIFFGISFYTLYNDFTSSWANNLPIYYAVTGLWALYGVAAMMNPSEKNTMYNILDMFSKNFFGVALFYAIWQLRINKY